MIDGVDTSHVDPTVDKGGERDTRVRPCTRRTWCKLNEHRHDTPCVEVPRAPLAPTDFGPRRRR